MITSGNRLAGPYEGTGALDTYSFSFKVFSKNDISVVVADTSGAETTLVLDSDYSVVLNADQDASPGGTITLLDGNLTVDYLLSIIGNLAYAQSTQLPNGGAYNAAVVEQMADKLAIQIQQVREIANRAMQLPVTAAGVSATLPAIVPGAVFAWNDAGDGIVAMQLTDLDTVLVSAAAADVIVQATIPLMRTALGASVVGSAVFTAASEAAARAALGVQGEALTTGGTSSAFTLTPNPAISAYVENQAFAAEFHTASTGTPTVNVSNLGAKNLKYRDGAGVLRTVGTLIPSGWRSELVYDGTDMIVMQMPLPVSVPMGQCRLTKSGSNLVLSRYQGRFLTIGGFNYEIDAAGVTCVPTSNVANTTYYIYAYISGGAIALEYSTTGHSTHTDGTEIKTGDSTRALVGMWRSGTSGGTWSSVTTEGRSWFNRGSLNQFLQLGSSPTTTSASVVEMATAFRAKFVCFADDEVDAVLHVRAGTSVDQYHDFKITMDGATDMPGSYQQTWGKQNNGSTGFGHYAIGRAVGLAEGYHDLRAYGSVTGGATLTWLVTDTYFSVSVR